MNLKEEPTEEPYRGATQSFQTWGKRIWVIIAGPLAIHYPHLPWSRGRDHVQQLGQNCKELWTFSSVQFRRSVVYNSLWPQGLQASLSITNSWSLLKLMSFELVMPSNHVILWCSLLFPPSIFPSIRVFPKRKECWTGRYNTAPPMQASANMLFSCGDYSDCKSHSFLLYKMY